MKTLKNIIAATAVALFSASSAHATLTNWYFDSDGAGANNAPVLVNDYLDLNGQAYVHNTFDTTNPANFTFNEAASILTVLADSSTPISPSITSTFFGSGQGTIGGVLTFNPGTSNLTMKNGATTIATFDLVEGSANLLANSTLPNGTVSLIFKATNLASGYFFDSSMNDLASLVSAPDGLLFGFATTNALPLTGNVDSNLVTSYNSHYGTSFGTVISNQTTDLYISNNGQFRLSVPEPASLALMALGLIGFSAVSRKKSL